MTKFTSYRRIKLRRLSKVLFALALGAAVAGCNGGGDKTTDSSGSTTGGVTSGKQLNVGIVYDSGGRGDKSFNDSAYNGLHKAETDLGIKTTPVESKNKSDYEPNLDSLADSGVDLIIAVGSDMKDAVEAVAPKYPKVKFATIDASVKGDNVRSLLFKEEEGSFLAGYCAGLVTKTNKLGFVGGEEIPLIKKFEVGYTAGAKTANPAIEVLPAKYTGNWDNVDDGKAAARVLFSSGADIVYSAAGRAGLGVIGEAQDENKFAIGVDSDQDDVSKGHVLTSMVKHVDNAVYSTIQDLKNGKFTPGDTVYDLKAGGVGLSPMTYTKDIVGQKNLDKIKAISDDISSGKIKVPSTQAELDTYLASAKK
jgi:basic membrane protein A